MVRPIAMIPGVVLLRLGGCKAHPPSRLERSIVTYADHRIL